MALDEFEHFLKEQASVYHEVVTDLAAGRKETHWMWFIFPQLAGLGRGHMAQRYALHSLEEARRFAEHPVLGQRLRECTRLVIQIQDRELSEIFWNPDDLKFHSCMTLFNLAAPEEPIFQSALDKYFDGEKDAGTIGLLNRSL